MESKILTAKEAAEYLKINKETLYRKVRKKIIPAYKIGNLWRFHKDVLDEIIKGKS